MEQSLCAPSQTPLDTPLVLQCQTCRTILGDSNFFVCSQAQLQTLTLRGASSVSIAEETHVVHSGAAQGW
ncbi:hypothetical protein CYMTET_44862 [Cymbomonas tetramitiformis]|uniref:Protein yippee-like n=1 Tax=Cymbomonas tetramitiformis TaxID=36881 RepID=A0AAE0BZD3_9CHLO|nr:hypothetical protein CYMTET_44862 [Cymbomonas tetramitiformis]